MIIKKTLRGCLDIKNMTAVYTDPENNIKARLAEELVGSCISGCLVLSVDSIDQRGQCIIAQNSEPNFGTVPIVYTVTAVTITPGEILSGLTVVNVDPNGLLLASNDYISVIAKLAKAGSKSTSIQKGQIISCRALKCKYELGKNKIAVVAEPFLQPHTAPTYCITKSELDMAVVNDWIERIKVEEQLCAGVDQMAYEKFSKLIHAYKTTDTGGENLMDLLASDFGTLYMCRDPKLDLSEPLVRSNDKEFGTVSPVKSIGGVVELLSDYFHLIKCLREMVTIYNTMDMLQSHENLWKMFTKNKLE